MKYLSWIKANKFTLLATAFSIVLLLLIITFYNALKTDHSLDLATEKLKLKEENRQLIERERNTLLQLIKKQDEDIRTMMKKDSVIQQKVSGINNQLENLSKQNNEKNKVINNYGSDELLNYFRNLPKQPDNDY